MPATTIPDRCPKCTADLTADDAVATVHGEPTCVLCGARPRVMLAFQDAERERLEAENTENAPRRGRTAAAARKSEVTVTASSAGNSSSNGG